MIPRINTPKLFTWEHLILASRLFCWVFPKATFTSRKEEIVAFARLLQGCYDLDKALTTAILAGLCTPGRLSHRESPLQCPVANVCCIALSMYRRERKLQIIYSKMHNGKGGWAESKTDESHSETYFPKLRDYTESWEKKKYDCYSISQCWQGGKSSCISICSGLGLEWKRIDGSSIPVFNCIKQLKYGSEQVLREILKTICDLNNKQLLGETQNGLTIIYYFVTSTK